MKKFLTFVVVIALIVLVVMILLGSKFDLGLFGSGTAFGDQAKEQEAETEPTKEEVEEETQDSTKGEAAETDDAGCVVIRIEEDKVYVDDVEMANAEELKQHIEDINTDDMTFELVENQSILATHEWVVGVFDELQITLMTSKEE
ncbi:MAG TPA: hypothetical protein PLQ04_00140 [Lachnospiraceae bacterium]|nr:hypothetical protein [Lachnospiraceae bacterium]